MESEVLLQRNMTGKGVPSCGTTVPATTATPVAGAGRLHKLASAITNADCPFPNCGIFQMMVRWSSSQNPPFPRAISTVFPFTFSGTATRIVKSFISPALSSRDRICTAIRTLVPLRVTLRSINYFCPCVVTKRMHMVLRVKYF